MSLYHYTSVPLAESIFSSSLKQNGKYKSQQLKEYHCVWLTESSDPNGHGLLTGAVMTSDEIQKRQESGEVVKNNSTQNKMQIRIELSKGNLKDFYWDMNKNKPPRGLIRYEDFSKKVGDSPIFRKLMGLSCYFDLKKLTPDVLDSLIANHPTQEGTWWLYFGEIPPKSFSGVSYLRSSGVAVPYDFETHGRSAVVQGGLHVASAPALADLHKIIAPVNPFETPKATAFCEVQHSPAAIFFTWDNSLWSISMDGKYEVTLKEGKIPARIDAIKQWMMAYAIELRQLWWAAVASYNRIYPNAPWSSLGPAI